MKQNKKIVIGLTGGSGSGKSAVAKIFSEFGAYIIDADEISHSITTSDKKVLEKIEKTFPDTVTDAGLNRRKLGSIVFADKEKLVKLNEIILPAIIDKMCLSAENSSAAITVIDAPLLFSSEKLVDLCDEIVVVAAPENVRIDRIVARDKISREEAKNRLASQVLQGELIARADKVFYNDGSLENLRSVVLDYLHNQA